MRMPTSFSSRIGARRARAHGGWLHQTDEPERISQAEARRRRRRRSRYQRRGFRHAVFDGECACRPPFLLGSGQGVLVLMEGGYIKRMNPNEYRRQKRGGVGVVDLDTKEEDFVTQFLTANAHADLLFFSDRGKVYQLKMYEVPEGKRATKGKSIMNFLSIEQEENIT